MVKFGYATINSIVQQISVKGVVQVKKFLSCFSVVLLICMLFTSTINAEAYTSIRVSSSNLTFDWDQTGGYFFIYTESDWLVTNSVSGWLRFEGQGYGGSKSGTGSSTLWFTMDKNTSEYSRTGYFIVVNTKNGEYQTVAITQKGLDRNNIIKITQNIDSTYDYKSHTVKLCFKSIDNWKIKSDSSFVTFRRSGGEGSNSEQFAYIFIDENTGSSDRTAKITLSSLNYNVSIEIKITQYKTPEFENVNVSGAVNMGNNSYWLDANSNTFYVNFKANVPWKFESSQIQASIKEGGPGTYHIKLTVPKYDSAKNLSAVFQAAFKGKDSSIPLTVQYVVYTSITDKPIKPR